ncbi:MAG: 5'/3'-nucleotidase SurE [Candidatus Hydrogenedens sp.]|nr:5'/3'-nucleotidase SurE [Candidatus Hydrogenedens sp.]
MKYPELILITNDDGIDAPGIRALKRVVDDLGIPCVVVAPADAHSGCSHRINMDTPFPVEQRAENEFAVFSTPADCVRIALHRLEKHPDLVLSGINAGGNMGHDVYLSGTVAAAREAAFHGLPAIAISQYISPAVHLDRVRIERDTRRILELLFQEPHERGVYWNVNFPDLPKGAEPPEITRCERCIQALPTHYLVENDQYTYERGKYHERPRTPGTDLDVCLNGAIAVTRMTL